MSKDEREERGRQPALDEPVGYGRPPRKSRFTKGKSGNPSGRPAGSRKLHTLIDDALDEKVVINENGRRRSITKREALSKQLVNSATLGDPRSIKLLVDVLRRSESEPGTSDNEVQLSEDDQKVMEVLIRRWAPGREDDDGNSNG